MSVEKTSSDTASLRAYNICNVHIEITPLIPAGTFDADCLWPFLSMAAHEPDCETAKNNEYLQRFIRNWPRPGDFGHSAIADGQLAGVVWARQFKPEEAVDFFVDEQTPEFVIAVKANMRRLGIAKLLLGRLLQAAAARKLAGLCLTVREGNPAIELYSQLQFKIVARGRNRVGGVSVGMVRRWSSSCSTNGRLASDIA